MRWPWRGHYRGRHRPQGIAAAGAVTANTAGPVTQAAAELAGARRRLAETRRRGAQVEQAADELAVLINRALHGGAV